MHEELTVRKSRAILLPVFLLFSVLAFSQPLFSISTDLTGSHSFKKEQRFFTFGQTIRGEIQFTPKDGAYVWYNYSSPGKFKNALTAVAKDSATPAEINFKSAAEINIKSFSMGWKHYLVGSGNSEEGWNLYFLAGFGLLSGKVSNKFDTPIDTAKYNLPANPVNGEGRFKRLTFDAAIGYEVPIGMTVYVYGEGRAYVPASDYPSKYLFANDNAPFLVSASIGLRILFD